MNKVFFSDDALSVVVIIVFPKLPLVSQSMVGKRTAKVYAAQAHLLRAYFFLIERV